MPQARMSTSGRKVAGRLDLGDPCLNHAVDGFLKIGAVAVAKTAAEEAYLMLKNGRLSQGNLENVLKHICKEGAYWGIIAGVYVGMKHGMERTRCGTKDWMNAMLAGALTGALVSAASDKNYVHNWEKIVMNAIAGGAIATASELLKHLT